jgi:Cft2 family RNA processing exonuclease
MITPEQFERAISVDNFKCPTPLYFLTHAHSDHLRGLSPKWKNGRVFMTRQSSRILSSIYRIPTRDHCIISPGAEFHTKYNGESLRIIPMDANHCPGSVILIFIARDWKVVHTGDFKLSDEMRQKAALLRNADIVYLDNTYDRPEHVFPPQEESIRSIIKLIEERHPKLVNIAIYTIGKNKVLHALYKRFQQPLYMPSRYRKCYEVLGQGFLTTDDKQRTMFHCYSRSYLERKMPDFDSDTLTIIPTGWAVDNNYEHAPYVYIPYSEHCDYNELQEFLDITKPAKIVNLVRHFHIS